MRIALIILIGIHGIIHLFGFLKAYELVEFNAISQAISKTYGLFWLLTFLLFSLTVILILTHSHYWWLSVFLGLIISQLLIFNYWSDAKFGSITNGLILLALIVAYSSFSFKKKIKDERIRMFESSQSNNQRIVSKESISDLPPVIQKWLINSGIIGKQFISRVHLVQELQLKLKTEQSDWQKGRAEQYFTVQPPAFNWSITTQMNPFMKVVGRDKFEDGMGEMKIKLFSLIPVANAKNDKNVNQASLQRYLAEIVWFPSAALSSHIKWVPLNDYSAKASMEYKGVVGEGEFHFDSNGDFQKFVAMRYQDSNATEPTEWTVTATKIEERNGVIIHTECEASWKLKDGKWTWLKLKVKDIHYKLEEMPLVDDLKSMPETS